MTREKKEQLKNTIKLFYMNSIHFDYYFDEWLFYQASKNFNISPKTAKKYFYQLLPKDVIEINCYQKMLLKNILKASKK